MFRSKEKKLAETMLGDAVLRQLHAGGALNAASLMEMLKVMKEQEQDAARKQACNDAIDTIRNSLSHSGSGGESSHVLHLFAGSGSSDDKKKH